MKKIALITALLLASTITFAQHREQRHHDMRPVYRDGSGWLVPSLIGGAIVYTIMNQPRETPPVIVQQPIVVQQPYPRTEYTVPTTTGTVYEERILWDSSCRCNRKFLIVVNPQQIITQ
jgi:hypothetical protein